MDSTCQSLLNHIMDWAANKSGQENGFQGNAYWIYGSPGMGKTLLQYHITQQAMTWCLPNMIRMCSSMHKMYSSIKYHLFESIWSACTTPILCIYPWPFSTTHHSASPIQQSPPSTSNTHLRYVLFCYSSLSSCANHESDSSSDSVSSISR